MKRPLHFQHRHRDEFINFRTVGLWSSFEAAAKQLSRNMRPDYLYVLKANLKVVSRLSYQLDIVAKTKTFWSSRFIAEETFFGAAAPRLWNELSVNIRASGILSMFRKCLKTCLFIRHFN